MSQHLREPLAAEHALPQKGSQAALWAADVVRYVNGESGPKVARQLARLCGDDSKVVTTQRSLADAVGHANRLGRTRSFTERGVKALVEAGWLRVEVEGKGRGARSTYYLLAGDRPDQAGGLAEAA